MNASKRYVPDIVYINIDSFYLFDHDNACLQTNQRMIYGRPVKCAGVV